MILKCPHCSKPVNLALVAPAAAPVPEAGCVVIQKSKYIDEKKIAQVSKPLTCACGHDAHDGPCPHGKGTAFGGCPCPGMHKRGRKALSPRPASFDAEPMTRGERTILAAIVQNGGCSREHITVLTGYKRSSRDTYIQKLFARGFLEHEGNHLTATEEGRTAVADIEELPKGDALREHWLEKLPVGESRVLQVVTAVYPRAIAREAITESTGYKRSSRDAYLQKLLVRRLIEKYQGDIRASDLLFDNAREP